MCVCVFQLSRHPILQPDIVKFWFEKEKIICKRNNNRGFRA